MVEPGPVHLPFRAGRTVTVTPRMLEVLPLMRQVLVEAARRRETVTYQELCRRTGAYQARSVGPVLDVLRVDGELRGEPRLDPLVVRATSGEVGPGYVGDAQEDRAACYAFWSS